MEYRALITKEGRRRLAEFPDCPGCQTFAESNEDIEAVAAEALEGWLETHLADGEAPPRPTSEKGLAIRVNAMLATKLQLRWARQDKGWSQAQLAKAAGVSQQMIHKVEDPDKATGFDVVERVARALGLEFNTSLD